MSSYSDKTVPELKSLAKKRGLKGYSKMNKKELISLLSSKSGSRRSSYKSYIHKPFLVVLYKKSKNQKTLVWEIEVINDVIIKRSYFLGSDAIKTSIIECIGKNIGKKNQTTPHEQALKEAKAEIDFKIEVEGYSRSIQQINIPKRQKVMLLKEGLENYTVDDVIIQPKIDGIRCQASYENGNWVLRSRNGKVFKFLYHIKEELENYNFDKTLIYDGELWTNRLSFQELSGVVSVNRLEPDYFERIVNFLIFDIIDNEDSIQIDRLEKLWTNVESPHIKFVEWYIIPLLEWPTYHDYFVRNGFEGSVVRTLYNKYVHGRSSCCRKIKDFDTSEVQIVGFKEGRGKDKGAIIWTAVMGHSPPFDVRSSAPIEIRKRMYEDALRNPTKFLGKELTIKHQGVSMDGIPRFPIGLALRDYE